MFNKIRAWWTTPVVRPAPAMLADRLAPQEFTREDARVLGTAPAEPPPERVSS